MHPTITHDVHGADDHDEMKNYVGALNSQRFSMVAVKYQGDDVGVLVSRPEGLKASVAAECRRQNFTKPSWSNSTHFHFHSISFNL
jgi:hypothetical protein